MSFQNYWTKRWSASSHLQTFPNAHQPNGPAGDAGGNPLQYNDGQLCHTCLWRPRGQIWRALSGGTWWVLSNQWRCFISEVDWVDFNRLALNNAYAILISSDSSFIKCNTRTHQLCKFSMISLTYIILAQDLILRDCLLLSGLEVKQRR